MLVLPSQHLVLTAWFGLRGVGRGALRLRRAMGKGFVSKCKDARAGGSRRFGHSLPASPRMPKSRNTHVIRATANDLLNFLISFLGAGCEERPLAQPFRGGASSCYMEHLKWRARCECRLNPTTPRLANRSHPTPLRKITHWRF